MSHRGLDATTMRVEMAEVGITVPKGEGDKLDPAATLAKAVSRAKPETNAAPRARKSVIKTAIVGGAPLRKEPADEFECA